LDIQNHHHHCCHGHCGAISTKFLKQDTSQKSSVMKLKAIVSTALLNRFALSFLWLVVDYGQKGYCHGQLDERRLRAIPCCAQAFEFATFWTAVVSI
jgi:hypothetical protein